MKSLYNWRYLLEKEPAMLVAAIGAILSALATLLPLPSATVTAITSALFLVLGLFTRSKVSPVSSPSSEVPDEPDTEEQA